VEKHYVINLLSEMCCLADAYDLRDVHQPINSCAYQHQSINFHSIPIRPPIASTSKVRYFPIVYDSFVSSVLNPSK